MYGRGGATGRGDAPALNLHIKIIYLFLLFVFNRFIFYLFLFSFCSVPNIRMRSSAKAPIDFKKINRGMTRGPLEDAAAAAAAATAAALGWAALSAPPTTLPLLSGGPLRGGRGFVQ